jgi:prefoldin alpha subunit
MSQESKEVPIEKLNPEQLQYVGKQLEGEINALSQSYTQLKIAGQKFSENREYVNDLSKCQDKEILVPLTSSVYLPGKCKNVKSVTVDVGANYYIEMNLDKAQEYFMRKIKMLSDNMERIDKTLKQKTQYMNIVNHHLGVIQQK